MWTTRLKFSIHRHHFAFVRLQDVTIKPNIYRRPHEAIYVAIQSIKQPIHTSVKKENIYTLPNLLTVSRICMCPLIYSSITAMQYPTALIYLTVASITDVLDGFIARRFGMGTMLGSVLDPFADKMLMTTLVIALSKVDLISMPITLLILGRDLGLIAGTAYYRYKSLPTPKTLSRYFDLSLPSAQVRPPLVSKVNTLLQLSLMWASLGAPVFEYTDATWLQFLNYGVAVTTVWSGVHYALFKENVKVLGRDWR